MVFDVFPSSLMLQCAYGGNSNGYMCTDRDHHSIKSNTHVFVCFLHLQFSMFLNWKNNAYARIPCGHRGSVTVQTILVVRLLPASLNLTLRLTRTMTMLITLASVATTFRRLWPNMHLFVCSRIHWSVVWKLLVFFVRERLVVIICRHMLPNMRF